MASIKRKRHSCGYCTVSGSHRHRDCPGTLSTASAGKPWTCWCHENGHPDVLPAPPSVEVAEEATEPSEAPSAKRYCEEEDCPGCGRDKPPAEAPKAPPAPKKPKADRCGAPTKRGPCNRRAGHTAGHDGR